MKEETEALSPEEILAVLTSVLGEPPNRCSMNQFCRHARRVLTRIQESKRPAVLQHKDSVAIICDYAVYLELEERRRQLEALLVRFPPHSGRTRARVGKLFENAEHQSILNMLRTVNKSIEHKRITHSSFKNRMEEEMERLEKEKSDLMAQLERIQSASLRARAAGSTEPVSSSKM